MPGSRRDGHTESKNVEIEMHVRADGLFGVLIDGKMHNGRVDRDTGRIEWISKPKFERPREACEQALAPPQPSDDGSPFRTRVHTTQAILCGDFNLEANEPEYAAITEPAPQGRLWDSWRVLHGEGARHASTFRLFDRTYGPDPVACDFVFVSDSLRDRVRSLAVDSETRDSDHQPVVVSLE